MLNEMIVVTVTTFSGTTTADKNGEDSVMLQLVAGTMPNRNVLSGTVARRTGIEVGKTYVMMVREQGYDQLFGTDYNFTKLMEITNPFELVKATKELGEPKLLVVGKPETFGPDSYERKGDAVEGQRAKRIKDGLYTPALSTTVVNHRTAHDIKLGTSLFGSGKILKEAEPVGTKANPEVVSRSAEVKDQQS